MARDNQSKISKKESNKRSKKEDEKSRNKKKNEESDSDNGEDESSDEMDVHEYRKFLSKLFPSKHLSKKINDGEKLKKVIEEDQEEEWETE